MEWLKEKAKGLAFTVLGLVVMLGWWTIRGPGDDPYRTYDKGSIPAVFWEGGDNRLQIEASNSGTATMRVSLEGKNPEAPDDESKQRWHQAWQQVEAGQHSWTVNFPDGVISGIVEFGADKPQVGDTLAWSVTLNGQLLQQDSAKLERPLEDGTAMFLQLELEEALAGLNPEAQ